ncbi:protein-L-isoaspartate O-methyltransferase family protein [Sulfuriflexus mobilis]|uniref:protein-L-isoaspartate O-methyltransferase family protein n=1 Tax=Sulfuriflexus mobilis TaxID=1811807 RepID=UPI000F84C801|nr:protein-L-isoaspartate O-methyltransferase [Sulfuriflexus mobilis]
MQNPDLELARHNMVVQQVRPCDVIDDHVLELMESVPRDAFVCEPCQKLAYTDTMIPLGHFEGDCPVMMTPIVEGKMLQALNVQPTETVLEIGTGSGYVTALLAKLARHVHSVEIIPALSASAKDKLAAQHIRNVTLEVGDAAHGWGAHAPYDVIAITGSLPVLEERFQQSLKVGGRLFVITGEGHAMQALLITRTSDHEWHYESLFETEIPALLNATQPQHFAF